MSWIHYIQCFLRLYNYGWPLNNLGTNCAGPVIHKFYTIHKYWYNVIRGWLNPWMQTCGPIISYMKISTAQGVITPNSHVQGSAVSALKITDSAFSQMELCLIWTRSLVVMVWCHFFKNYNIFTLSNNHRYKLNWTNSFRGVKVSAQFNLLIGVNLSFSSVEKKNISKCF